MYAELLGVAGVLGVRLTRFDRAAVDLGVFRDEAGTDVGVFRDEAGAGVEFLAGLGLALKPIGVCVKVGLDLCLVCSDGVAAVSSSSWSSADRDVLEGDSSTTSSWRRPLLLGSTRRLFAGRSVLAVLFWEALRLLACLGVAGS